MPVELLLVLLTSVDSARFEFSISSALPGVEDFFALAWFFFAGIFVRVADEPFDCVCLGALLLLAADFFEGAGALLAKNFFAGALLAVFADVTFLGAADFFVAAFFGAALLLAFLGAGEREKDFVAAFFDVALPAVFLATAFFAGALEEAFFIADFFVADFFSAAFLGAAFLGAVFLAAAFFEAPFFVAVFFAAVFFAGAFDIEPRLLLIFFDVDFEELARPAADVELLFFTADFLPALCLELLLVEGFEPPFFAVAFFVAFAILMGFSEG